MKVIIGVSLLGTAAVLAVGTYLLPAGSQVDRGATVTTVEVTAPPPQPLMR